MAPQGALEVIQEPPSNQIWRLLSLTLILGSGFLGFMAILLWIINRQGNLEQAQIPSTSLLAGMLYLALAILAAARLRGYAKVPSVAAFVIAGAAMTLLLDQIWALEIPGGQLRRATLIAIGVEETMLPSLLTAAAIFALAISLGLTHPDGRDKNVVTLFASYLALLVPIAAAYGYLLSVPNPDLFVDQTGVSIWSSIALTCLAFAQILIASKHSLRRFKTVALANPFSMS